MKTCIIVDCPVRRGPSCCIDCDQKVGCRALCSRVDATGKVPTPPCPDCREVLQ